MKEIHVATFGTPGAGKLQSPLPPVALTALQAIQSTKVYPKGSEFFLEGQSPTGIYILYSGRAEMSVTDNEGRKMMLGMALPGDVLGLSAVVSGKHHAKTAVAAMPSQAGFIKSKDFLHFLEHHSEAAFWVVQLLSDRVITTLEQISSIKHTPSRDIRE